MSLQLGLPNQVLALNKALTHQTLPEISPLPDKQVCIPVCNSLTERQLASPSVLHLQEENSAFEAVKSLLAALQQT